MKAYKCDRCGAYFTKWVAPEKIIVKMISSPMTKSEDYVDICPDCQKTLDNWWSNKVELADDKA